MKLHHLLSAWLLMFVTTASAMAQDRTVLGIDLGAPFRVPACSSGPAHPCVSGTPAGRTAWGADEYHVALSSAPPYVRGELRVFVVGGITESVQIETWGIEAQWNALNALTKKYGTPTRYREQKLRGLRSRYPTKFAEWDLKDLAVRFDGATGSVDWGRIEISTNRYRKRLEDHGSAAKKSGG